MSTEVRFLGYTVGLYTCFIYWGYLQEKLTSTKYNSNVVGESVEWDSAFALNMFVSLGGYTVASIVEKMILSSSDSDSEVKIAVPITAFWKVAISNTLASPIGYAALKYISFPLVILAKASKPVPVIIIGMVFYGKTYTWYKMVGVALLCVGIALFSSAKGGSMASSSSGNDTTNLLIGIFLVALNLLLDGYTNNEQDQIFEKLGATSIQMMKYINLWTSFYISTYLFIGYVLFREQSEVLGAYNSFSHSKELRFDILMFCIFAVVGQVIIFAVMKEFGSLAWITISITRKLFTILFSVFMFNHSVKNIQWVGIFCVFLGMTIEVVMGYVEIQKYNNVELCNKDNGFSPPKRIQGFISNFHKN
jgi:UDP-galactose transporter B1